MTEHPGSAAVGKVSTVFRVGPDFLVRGEYKQTGLHFEWDPCLPKRRLSDAEMAAYRRGRDAFVAQIHLSTGVKIMMVEA